MELGWRMEGEGEGEGVGTGGARVEVDYQVVGSTCRVHVHVYTCTPVLHVYGRRPRGLIPASGCPGPRHFNLLGLFLY